MYFGLPDDALALREGLRDVLSTACTPATVRAAWDGSTSEALWKELASFGVFGILVPEADGGLGLDALSFVAAMEECGYAGVPGPLVETVAFAPRLGLPLDGSARLAVVRRDGEVTPYAATATHVFSTEAHRLLDVQSVEPRATVDASRQAAVVTGTPAGPEPELELVSTQEFRERHDGRPPASSRDLAVLGTAAFLLGLARRQLDLTVAYAKERKQFGVPIGSFQAIKHALADAVLGTEFAWPVVLQAAHELGTDPTSVRVSAAKAMAGDAAYRVSRTCLQAHGAIGYTVEYDLHLFTKRTWALSQDWGTSAQHRATVARHLRHL